MKELDTRATEWSEFADTVQEHIEEYTVPQYGQKGEDQLTEWTAADCVKQINKYANRFGKNQREGQELMDLVKMAHYCAVAWIKLQEK